jgi:L-lactate dehydrogenase complex protein LldG
MSARDAILSRIRKSLGVPPGDPGRRAIVISRLDSPPRGVIPARGQLPTEERVTLFTAMAEKVSASVARIAADDALPDAVATFLRDANLPAAIRMGNDPKLRGLPWYRVQQLSIAYGPSDGSDAVTLSHAVAGVAETGTLVLASGPDNPTTLNFLPDTHIVAVRAADIAGDYESVWKIIRARYGKGTMPRTVNMITGPSRSADIEQTLLLGAHGPRRLHIVIIG